MQGIQKGICIFKQGNDSCHIKHLLLSKERGRLPTDIQQIVYLCIKLQNKEENDMKKLLEAALTLSLGMTMLTA